MNVQDTVAVLRSLARFSLSDGAKVTLLVFIAESLSKSGYSPSYTELEKIRGVARSTVQLHIEELENCGVLFSARLPDNRKKYAVNYDVLNHPENKVEPVKYEKPKRAYKAHDLLRYFAVKTSCTARDTSLTAKSAHGAMRRLLNSLGARRAIFLIDRFSVEAKRRKLPCSLRGFFEFAASVKDEEQLPRVSAHTRVK